MKFLAGVDLATFDMGRAVIDLTGQRFGRLVVECRDGHKGKRIQWRCRCDCGAPKGAIRDHLISGRVKSCGCLRSEVSRRSTTKLLAEGRMPKPFQYDDPEQPVNKVISNYELNAKSRGLGFLLTDSECRELFASPCFYCGAEKSNKGRKGYRYNGIDRLDNLRGYVAGNVVASCKLCNRAKGTTSEEGFKEWIVRVYTRWASLP